MEQGPDHMTGYCSRLITGLVACAVVAVTLHADVAAVAIAGAVMLIVVAVSCLMLRDGRL